MSFGISSGRGRFRLTPLAAALGSIVALPLLIANSAYAQDSSDPDELAQEATIEEIVVTSRRYEESISDAPVSVAVLSEDFLDERRIDRVDDIFSYTPGATYESFSKLQPTASIRGLVAPTPGNASSESSIQTVIDSVVVTKDFMKGTPLFDLARVEVLRGPQGTAFGRNASAGLLHFVTNGPDIGENYGGITASVGNRERFEVDGFYNLSISDRAALRLSFRHEQEDGQTDGFTIDDLTNEVENIGGIDGEQATAVRLQLALDPTDNFSAKFKLEYSADRDESPIRELCNPGPGINNFDVLTTPAGVESITDACDTPFDQFISEEDDPDFAGFLDPADFGLDRDIFTATAELSWALPNGLNITSVTGYGDGDTDNLSDVIGTAADINWQAVTNDGDFLSTELRIDNVGTASKFQWLAGVYLLRDEETRVETLNFQQRDQRGGVFVPTVRETGGTGETRSWSIFGEISYDLTDRATITYGGRFLNDDKDYITRAGGFGFSGQLAGLPGVGGNVLDSAGNPVPAVCQPFMPPPNIMTNICPEITFPEFEQSESFSEYISKASIDYVFSDTVTGYFLWSQGFKSGAFQPDALNFDQASIVTEPEESTNFEVGLKGQSSRYRYAVTVFNIELDDVQAVNQVDLGNGAFAGLISNIGNVETTGVELEGAFALTPNLTVTGSFAWLDSEIGGNTPDPEGLIDPATGAPFILDGERPGGAPDWTFNVAMDYLHVLNSGSSVALRADLRGRDDVFFQNRRRFSPIDGSPDDALLRPTIIDLGAQITWTSANENLDVTIWGKNLLEDVDITNFSPFVGGGINDFAIGFRGLREFGLTASYGF